MKERTMVGYRNCSWAVGGVAGWSLGLVGKGYGGRLYSFTGLPRLTPKTGRAT